MNETFWTLLRNAAHWEFEIFLTLVTEAATAGIGWLIVRKHWRHHLDRDVRESVQDWSTNPIAEAAGHIGECAQCEGERVLLDTSVVMCRSCGHVTVPTR